MRVFILVLMALVFAGCQTTSKPPIIVTKNRVIEIPPQFLVCRGVEWPDPATLTDKQVARLLEKLATVNAECRANMGAIKKFLAAARSGAKPS